jgi:hypothetical protein
MELALFYIPICDGFESPKFHVHFIQMYSIRLLEPNPHFPLFHLLCPCQVSKPWHGYSPATIEGKGKRVEGDVIKLKGKLNCYFPPHTPQSLNPSLHCPTPVRAFNPDRGISPNDKLGNSWQKRGSGRIEWLLEAVATVKGKFNGDYIL